MYPQDALQLLFGLSSHFKQAYDVYQIVLTAQQARVFDEFETIIKQYQPNHFETDRVISSYKKNLKGIKNTFLHTPSNGHIEEINRRIKQIGRTNYG